MLQSVLEQKMALAAYAAENDIPQLTANQLEIACNMVLILAPVEKITQAISKQTATLSVVIPMIRVLLRSWEKEDDDRGVQTMKNEMVKSLKGRFAGIEDNYLFSAATIVDPRFKDRFFLSNISKSIAKEAVQEELRKISGASDSEADASASESRTDSPSPKKQKQGSLLELFSDILDDSCADDSSSTNELDCYLREPVLDYKMRKPFTWWAKHHSRYPAMAQIAKCYLTATATSVPSEKLFSSAGDIYDERRSRITPEHAESLLFIKSNYSLFGKK